MKRNFAIVSVLFAYLNGCSNVPTANFVKDSSTSAAESSSSAAESHTSGAQEILPGSKGGILPGSKGERNLLSDLEVQVNLPDLDSDFAVQSEYEHWQFKLDQQTLLSPRILSVVHEDQKLLLTVKLENLTLSSNINYQELIIQSTDGIVQAAAVIPALKTDQHRLASPLTTKSTAIWLLAKAAEKSSGQSLQSMQPEEFQMIENDPELQSLVQALETAYKESKGKSQPEKNQAVQEVLQKTTQKSSEIIPQPENNHNPKSDSGTRPKPDQKCSRENQNRSYWHKPSSWPLFGRDDLISCSDSSVAKTNSSSHQKSNAKK